MIVYAAVMASTGREKFNASIDRAATMFDRSSGFAVCHDQSSG